MADMDTGSIGAVSVDSAVHHDSTVPLLGAVSVDSAAHYESAVPLLGAVSVESIESGKGTSDKQIGAVLVDKSDAVGTNIAMFL